MKRSVGVVVIAVTLFAQAARSAPPDAVADLREFTKTAWGVCVMKAVGYSITGDIKDRDSTDACVTIALPDGKTKALSAISTAKGRRADLIREYYAAWATSMQSIPGLQTLSTAGDDFVVRRDKLQERFEEKWMLLDLDAK
jgi:hypothetical protein